MRAGLAAALDGRTAPDRSRFSVDAVTARSAIDLLIGACRAVESSVPGTRTPKRDLYARRAEVERRLFAGELALLDAVRRPPPLDIVSGAGLARRATCRSSTCARRRA